MNILNTGQSISPLPAKSNPLIPSKTLYQQINFPKMKPILQKRVTFRCSTLSSLTYITKSRPKMLSTIELISLQSNQPNFKAVRTICKALQDAKKASSLIIREDDSNSQNLKQLKHIFNNTHLHWKKLTVSFISSDGEGHPLDREAVEIATRLRRCRNLSYLDVYLCCSKDLKNHILSHLFQQLKGLKTLSALRLDLSGCKNREELPQDYEPNFLTLTFKYPRSLKHLSLDLQPSNFPDQKMLSIFATNLSRCTSLINFNLQCGFNHTRPLDVKILAPLFERVQSVKSLKINQIFQPFIQIQDSINFARSFECLKNLTKLDLFVFFCPGDTSTVFVKELFKYLASLTNLKNLKLHISFDKSSSNNDDPAEQDLFLPLKSLINLQTFRLSLQCGRDQKLPELQSLSQALQTLHGLENFELLFLWNKVSRSHIISLSQMFKKMTSLRIIMLMFYDADLEPDSLELLSKAISHLKLSVFLFEVRDRKLDLPQQQKNSVIWKHEKGLIPFFSAIGNFSSLLSLDLNLSVFSLLTKELSSLSLELGKMKQLRCLSLELPTLPSCSNFKGLRSLMSSIKEMSNLAYLHLVFQGDKLCDEEVELVASNLAECSRSLKILDLAFHETKVLKNRSIIALQNGLQPLFALKRLTLVFGPNNVFDGETVYGLFEVLSSLKSLEIITIEIPAEVVPSDFENILKRFAGHWNLRAFLVNKQSCLKSVDQN